MPAPFFHGTVMNNEMRFGYVIKDPKKRGYGYGKEMPTLGIRFAFDIYGAEKVSLGVFENNPSVYHYYRAEGCKDVTGDEAESYPVLGED